jgi:WD40 repeat protein
MRRPRGQSLLFSTFLLWFTALGMSRVAWAADPGATTRPISFGTEIAPIFLQQCQGCHGPEKAKGQYRVDTFQRLMKPGKSKAAPVVAGKPEKSEIFRLISTNDEDDRMPQKADRLSDKQIASIKQWIEQGAKFDSTDPAATLASLSERKNPVPPEVYRQPLPVTAVAFSPDGSELAVSGYHEITVWDPATGKLLRRIQNLPERIWSLAYRPDGKTLAAAGGTPGLIGSITVCDPASHRAEKVLARIADMMLVVRFSPDGKRLAVGGADNAVRIFGVESGERELLIEQHADWITDLAFSPDGSQIATASRDKSSRVFDAKTGAMEAAYLKHEEAVLGVTWAQDGKLIYTAGKDRKIHAWAAADGKPAGEISTLNGDPFKVEAALGFLFSCSADGIVRDYSQANRELVRTFPPAADWVYCLAIDSKNRRVAGGCYNGEVVIWDVDSGAILRKFVAAPGYPVSQPVKK